MEERKEKFTPGPWHQGVYDNPKRLALAVFDEGHNEVAVADTVDSAALISAAPDMYAALSCVLALASTPTTKGELVYVDFTEIRSALSKARGEY